MKKYIEGEPLRTERTGVYKVGKGTLINRDTDALNSYKKRKRKMQQIDDLKDTVYELKKDIQEIKQLLKGLSK